MRTLVPILSAALLFSSSAALAAGPSKKSHTLARVAHIEHAPGRSTGSPTDGHLVGGAHVTESPYLRIVPVYANQDVRWGLEPLVSMIDRAARQVRRQFPDSVLSVGHLSQKGGGEIDRHASHESGRDADIGFYIVNDRKKPVYEEHFVQFTADGKAPSWPGAHFDDARNWALVQAFVTDPSANVSHIFVAAPLRARLLAYASSMHVADHIRVRASELLAQPHGALPHDDHFHVRIACPSHMTGCIEQPQPHHNAVAHHSTKQGSGARAHGSSAPAPHAAAPSSHAAKKDHRDDDDTDDGAESASAHQSDEAPMPSLTPSVSGLDSVVIPSPLRAPPTPAAMPAPSAPIDDVDGVLEK